MAQRSATWFLGVAAASVFVSLLMVPSLEMLVHSNLPWWLHIPIAGAVLTLLAGGGAAAGLAFAEYRARSAGSRKQA